MLSTNAKHHHECCHVRNPGDAFIPAAYHSKEMMSMIVVPKVSSRWLETLNWVTPPMTEFKILKPGYEKIVKALGIPKETVL